MTWSDMSKFVGMNPDLRAVGNEAFKPDQLLLVGGDGIAVEDFLLMPIEHWFGIGRG